MSPQSRPPLATIISEEIASIAKTTGSSTIDLPESIADRVGVTRRSIEITLTRLEEAGVIVWHRKRAGGIRRPWWRVEVIECPHVVGKVARDV